MARTKHMSDEELLKIALECFLEKGHNVSAQVIADKVGISQPTLFKRFGTKEELFLRAVAPKERLPVVDLIEALPTSEPMQPQIEQLLKLVWKALDEVMPMVQLLKSARIPREKVMARYKTSPPDMLIAAIVGFFERAKEQGKVKPKTNPHHLAQLIFGILMGKSFIDKSVSGIFHEGADTFIKSTASLLSKGILDD